MLTPLSLFLLCPAGPFDVSAPSTTATLMGTDVLGPSGHKALVPVWEEGDIGRTFWVRTFWALLGTAFPADVHFLQGHHCPLLLQGAVVGCGQGSTAPGAYCNLGSRTFVHSQISTPASPPFSSATGKVGR